MDSTQFKYLEELHRLGEVSKALKTVSGPVSLDIETHGGTNLNPWRGDIRLLSLAILDHPAWLLDLDRIGYDLGDLGRCLEQRQVLAHNAKFDLLWLRHKCGLKLDNVFCTLTAARLLSNGRREQKNNLYTCWERFLGVPPGKDQSRSDWGGMLLTNDQLEYAALDVVHLHRLKDAQMLEIDKTGLGRVLEVENRLIPVVVEMEHRGIGAHRERLEGLLEDYIAELAKAERIVAEEFGQQVNLNSPKQLKAALVAKGLDLPNTSEQTLSESGHHLAGGILNYRWAKKQVEQTETILKAIEPDNRIHGRFEPSGTNTGRFSSRTPNLQNISRGRLRNCFVPAPGHLLVVAAQIAEEKRMIEAFKEGEDLHRQTASLVLGIPAQEVSKEDRQLAKAVNFGLLYGQSAKGLMNYAKTTYEVDLDLQRAASIRERFFEAYTGIRKWHQDAHKKASQGVQEVRTTLGRVRWLPTEKDAEWHRFIGLVNTSVQGGSADALKLAMVDLSQQLPEGAGLVSTVHDELIVECLADQAETVKTLLEEAMLAAATQLYPAVSFEVEANICEDWSEK